MNIRFFPWQTSNTHEKKKLIHRLDDSWISNVPSKRWKWLIVFIYSMHVSQRNIIQLLAMRDKLIPTISDANCKQSCENLFAHTTTSVEPSVHRAKTLVPLWKYKWNMRLVTDSPTALHWVSVRSIFVCNQSHVESVLFRNYLMNHYTSLYAVYANLIVNPRTWFISNDINQNNRCLRYRSIWICSIYAHHRWCLLSMAIECVYRGIDSHFYSMGKYVKQSMTRCLQSH